MIKNIKSIRGMKDYFITETNIFQHIENKIKKILFSYGYNEIKIPIIENTLLFKRAIGEITDIIEKEMFTFQSRKGVFLTLRPEGTAGCVRALIQNNLIFQKQRFWYSGPMFRYERPQKGRYRQFYQLGIEVFGFSQFTIDAELIILNKKFWESLKIDKYITLNINSIGSLQSRENYKKDLIIFLEKNKNFLDENCKKRLYKNPLRILDSKNIVVQNLLKKAPKLKNYINEKSHSHFKNLISILERLNIKYNINENLVRGLDYYNDTVFEWNTDKIGSQNAICAGGRYDLLVERLGGKKTPAIGFAIGIDRLILAMKKITNLQHQKKIDLNIVITDKFIEKDALILIELLREKNLEFKITMNFDKLKTKKKFFSYINTMSSRFLLILEKENFTQKKFLLRDISKNINIILSKQELIKNLKNILNK